MGCDQGSEGKEPGTKTEVNRETHSDGGAKEGPCRRDLRSVGCSNPPLRPGGRELQTVVPETRYAGEKRGYVGAEGETRPEHTALGGAEEQEARERLDQKEEASHLCSLKITQASCDVDWREGGRCGSKENHDRGQGLQLGQWQQRWTSEAKHEDLRMDWMWG